MKKNNIEKFAKKSYKKPELKEIGSVLNFTKNNGTSQNQDNGQSGQVRYS